MAGLELSGAFYREAVEPIMRKRFPDLPYAAARVGPGSDVFGFDDARSTDHFWGPLLNVILRQDDYARFADQINRALADELPFEVRGFPTNFRPFEGDEAHQKDGQYPDGRRVRATEPQPEIPGVRRLEREETDQQAEHAPGNVKTQKYGP